MARSWRGLAAVVLAALASGCGHGLGGRPVVIAARSSPSTLDPHLHNELDVWSLLCNFYDSLVEFDARMKIRPALAVSWRRVDSAHMRFELRRGVRFQDGEPFTAADVVASYLRALGHPRTGIRHLLRGIVAMRALGPYELEVETDGPAPTLLNRLALLFVVPERQSRVDEITAPVGTGSYRFVRRRSDGSVVAEAWDGWRGRPKIAEVEFHFIDSDEERGAGFLAGRYDIAVPISEDDAAAVRRHPGLRTQLQPTLLVRLLMVVPDAALGRTRAALSDPRVRRAMLLAIDRDHLVDEVLEGNATVASQFIHPVVFGFDPGIAPLPCDPVESRRLLAEAGFADGFDVELVHGGLGAGLISAVVNDLARIGVRVRVREAPLAQLLQEARDRTVPLFTLSRMCTTGDAAELFDSSLHSIDPLHGYGGENYGGYSNPAVDEALDRAGRELDPAQRLLLLQRAQRVALTELPILPLVVRWEHMGLSSRLEVVPRHDAWLRVADFRLRSP